MEPCLLVELEPETNHLEKISQVMAELLLESRYLVESGNGDFTLVFHSDPKTFSSCVVWCATRFQELKESKAIGNFTMNALNYQHHSDVILENYKVDAPFVEASPEKNCNVM